MNLKCISKDLKAHQKVMKSLQELQTNQATKAKIKDQKNIKFKVRKAKKIIRFK